MDPATYRRLRIIDAVAWPAATLLVVFKDTQPDRVGAVHTLIGLLIVTWGARKLGHARDGWRPPDGVSVWFNPFNPLGWLAAGLSRITARRGGEYRFITLTVLKVAGVILAIWLAMLLQTGAWRNGLAVLLN
jgi:hypothetical protein